MIEFMNTIPSGSISVNVYTYIVHVHCHAFDCVFIFYVDLRLGSCNLQCITLFSVRLLYMYIHVFK